MAKAGNAVGLQLFVLIFFFLANGECSFWESEWKWRRKTGKDPQSQSCLNCNSHKKLKVASVEIRNMQSSRFLHDFSLFAKASAVQEMHSAINRLYFKLLKTKVVQLCTAHGDTNK